MANGPAGSLSVLVKKITDTICNVLECLRKYVFRNLLLQKLSPKEGKICGKSLKKRQKCASSKVASDQKLR